MSQLVPAVDESYEFPEVQYLDESKPLELYSDGKSFDEKATEGSKGFNYEGIELANPLQTSGVDTFDQAFDAGRLQTLELMDLVQMFVVYAFIIAAALSAIFIFVGGISFILSGGNDEKIKQAINTIRYSIIGLIVTILSFTFVTIVGRMFGLNFLDYLSYGQIKESVNRLISTGEPPNEKFEIQ